MQKPTSLPKSCDVLIIGAGPVGAALANLLGKHGVDVVLIERHQGILEIPRAVHLDGETMRIIQNMGLAPEALKILRQGSVMQWVNAKHELLLERRAVIGLGAQGWHNNNYYHQPQLEAVFRSGISRFPHVQLHEGWTLKAAVDQGHCVEATLVATQDEKVESLICAKYMVGCDGAKSMVRGLLSKDQAFDTLADPQAWVVVDGVLDHPLNQPEWSVQYCDPKRPATGIFINATRRRWELMVLPGEDGQELLKEEVLWDLLSKWVKPTQVKLERAAIYTFHARLAKVWQRGRIAIAGDAAHQTPPFLGQGLCAGLRDAANLSWKLVHALGQTNTSSGLLKTYEIERYPHARAFIELAVEVGDVIQELDPTKAAERDARMLKEGMSFMFPSPVLGNGLHRARENAPIVGQIGPQFEMADGRWSDDLAPGAWALWVRDATALTSTLKQQAADLGMPVVEADTEAMNAWLNKHQALAAIMRPDHYIYDLCIDSETLARSLGQLAKELM